MIRHFKASHPDTSRCAQYWSEKAWAPVRINRPAHWFQSEADRAKEVGPVALAGPSVNHADSVEKPCVNAFAGLALRQPGARPPSLEDVAAYMSLFEGLLQFVLLPGCIPEATLSFQIGAGLCQRLCLQLFGVSVLRGGALTRNLC